MPPRPPQADAVTILHARIERLIEMSGVSYTFLRPGAFATNARIWWAVRALCEDGHDGAKYLLTGPESLTHRDQVRIIGAAIGRAIRFEEIPPEVARREMAIAMSPSIADMLLNA